MQRRSFLMPAAILLAIYAGVAAAQKESIVGLWLPQNTDEIADGRVVRHVEGIIFNFQTPGGSPMLPTVTIEGEADGKALRTVTGKPDDRTGFVAVPIVNLDTYKLRRLTVESDGRKWVIENPPQEFRLSLEK